MATSVGGVPSGSSARTTHPKVPCPNTPVCSTTASQPLLILRPAKGRICMPAFFCKTQLFLAPAALTCMYLPRLSTAFAGTVWSFCRGPASAFSASQAERMVEAASIRSAHAIVAGFTSSAPTANASNPPRLPPLRPAQHVSSSHQMRFVLWLMAASTIATKKQKSEWCLGICTVSKGQPYNSRPSIKLKLPYLLRRTCSEDELVCCAQTRWQG